MPTPPKESIGGSKPHQLAAFEAVQNEFRYLTKLENLAKSEDFEELDEFEQAQILSEIDMRSRAYEVLNARVLNY